jgi:hypothetical protein
MTNGCIVHLSQKNIKIQEFIRRITAQSLWPGQAQKVKPDKEYDIPIILWENPLEKSRVMIYQYPYNNCSRRESS